MTRLVEKEYRAVVLQLQEEEQHSVLKIVWRSCTAGSVDDCDWPRCSGVASFIRHDDSSYLHMHSSLTA